MISNVKRQRIDESSIQINNNEILSNFFDFFEASFFFIGIEQKKSLIVPISPKSQFDLGKALASYLISKPFLNRIVFSHLRNFGQDFWQTIFSFLSSNQKLDCLLFISCQFNFRQRDLCLSNLIRYNKGLKSLGFRNHDEYFEKVNYPQFIEALHDSTTLKSFVLSPYSGIIDYNSVYQGARNSAFRQLNPHSVLEASIQCDKIFSHPSSANIKELLLTKFFNTPCKREQFVRFLPILSTVTTLEQLDLSGNSLFKDIENNSLVVAFLRSLVTNPTLRKLNLSELRLPSKEAAGIIPEIIAKNTILVDLHLKCMTLVDFHIDKELGQAIGLNSMLGFLDLSSNYLNSKEFGSALVQSMKQNQTLSALVLKSNFLNSKKFLSEFGDAMTVNQTLKILSLQSTSQRGEIEALFKTLSLNTSIIFLNLTQNRFSLPAAASLKTFLTTNTTLRKLDLSATKMTHKMVSLVVDGICANNSLSSVNLSENHVTQAHIETIIRHNSALRKLTVFSSKAITDLDLPGLMKALRCNNSMQCLMLNQISTSFEHVDPFGRFLSEKPNLKRIMFKAPKLVFHPFDYLMLCKKHLASHYCIQQLPYIRSSQYDFSQSDLNEIFKRNLQIRRCNKALRSSSLFNLLLIFSKFID